ncbi:MAG: Gldg family protein, partial [Elainellaceae cyanobacterium]
MKKPLSLNPKVFTILGWLAPVLLIMGITAGLVAGTWGIVPIGLLIAGGVCLLLWLLADWRSLPGFFNQRSTQAGTNAVVATLAVLVIVGLINFLTVRYGTRVDLTENQIFTLSPQTQEVVSNLELPTKVWVFWDDSVPPSRADRELLENYSRESEQFTYEYVDPQVDIAISRDFGVQAIGEVHLQIGDSRRLVQVVNEQTGLSERQLTNAMLQATTDRQLTAYLLQGHGELELSPGQGGMSEAIALLEGENYLIEPLNLTEQGAVPDDANVVIVAGAQRSLLEGEVTALQDFSQKKGGLLLLIDPDTDPGLDPILDDWGVALDNLLVLDPTADSLQLGLTTALVQTYGDHPITQDFGGGISFYPETQVVELSSEATTEPSEAETENTAEDSPDETLEAANAPESAPLLLTNEQSQAFEIPEDGNILL